MPDSRDFGKIINERRLSLGYSLGQLANRMGTTATKVRAWERGDAVPDAETIEQLAEELNMSAGVLRATLPDADVEDSQLERSDSDEPTAAIAEASFSDAADTAAAEVDEPDAPEELPVADTGDRLDPDEPTAVVVADAATGSDLADESDVADGDETAVDMVDDEGDGDDDPQDDADHDAEPPLVDLPTEEVAVVAAPLLEPGAGLLAAAPAAIATAPAPTRIDPNDLGVPESSGLFAPVEQFMATVFDPERPYLFWIRVALIVLVFFVFLRILAWAVPEFFDVLKDILDTIESTPSEADPGTQFIDG